MADRSDLRRNVYRKGGARPSRWQEDHWRFKKLGPIRYGDTRIHKLLVVLTIALYPANLVLCDSIERIFARELYADIPRGVFLVRGENVLLMGEIVCLQSVGIQDNANTFTPGS